MGERYQIHLRFNSATLEKPKYESIHLQWCWGSHIIRNLNRLLKTLKNTECEYPDSYDLGKYARSILDVNKGIEGHNYPFGIFKEDEPYDTHTGDSNHGWCVVFVDITKKGKFRVESKFYDTEGKPISNNVLWKNALNELKYYKTDKKTIDKFKKLLDKKLFNNTKEDLQGIFNKGIKLLSEEKEEKIKREGHKLKFTINEKGKDYFKTFNRIGKELKEKGFDIQGYF